MYRRCCCYLLAGTGTPDIPGILFIGVLFFVLLSRYFFIIFLVAPLGKIYRYLRKQAKTTE